MAESSRSKTSPPRVVEAIVEAAKNAFDPSLDPGSQKARLKEYDSLIARHPNALPPWLREPLLKTLTLLPLRADGVRGTLEFVFSVHPSNNATVVEASQRQNKGAGITQEAVAVATKLLSSVPAGILPEAWYSGISEQMFSLIDGEAGPDLGRTAAQIVGFGILGKRRFGAPGAPGWQVFVQPLLEDVNPSLWAVDRHIGAEAVAGAEGLIDLTRDGILVPASSCEKSLNRLKVLILSNPSPGLCKRVLSPVILQLWCLSAWKGLPPAIERRFCDPARTLVQTYLRLFSSLDEMLPIVHNITCAGSTDPRRPMWRYQLHDEEGIAAVAPRAFASPHGDNFADIDEKAATFVTTIKTACSSEDISTVFVHLLGRRLESAEKAEGGHVQVTYEETDDKGLERDFIEAKVLQQFMDKIPEDLVSRFDQLLTVICRVLTTDGRLCLGDDLTAVVLSLLHLVITAPNFRRSSIKPGELKSIEEGLARIARMPQREISTTAKNLRMLLRNIDEMEDMDGSLPSAPSARQVEDRKTYNLAMSYITGQSDNPPPVVSEGLNLLSGLIVSESSILDITAVTVLMSSMLKENEDYINFRVMKVFTQLANKHPRSTIRELLDNYLDAQEKSSTDIRLRFGEALVRVIERLGATFTGQMAEQVCETLLSIAGRRGYRPKTLARKDREERLRNMKMAQGEEADENDNEAVDLGELTAEERTNNDILARIIQGWESKRGSEDVRMRTSSLSIFGVALETNIGGIGPTLASDGVDLCANILTLEPELEFGILRRAAVMAVMSFVRALDEAKESKQSLGFGLTSSSRTEIQQTLAYVAQTDNDGLVQQHAHDVAESLEHWRLSSMLPSQGERTLPSLGRLAGLQLNLEGAVVDASDRPRPRIEEVE
ncbi:hypothetical protein DCS_07274 [Drechmeria coniospora]|uniref:Protein required for cell viability n=1 Tax=Drechmeria coniospora TaxID=98403 RepID=A0A151GE17_DRECN|nr:hypothetical protein DCS_07274 [Drechmeria coniospora]KYK55311.1 hypothetical protein DCS_07274 [Drechmeria coniospora]